MFGFDTSRCSRTPRAQPVSRKVPSNAIPSFRSPDVLENTWPILSATVPQSSPSPLNGERAGVRGENVDRFTQIPPRPKTTEQVVSLDLAPPAKKLLISRYARSMIGLRRRKLVLRTALLA